MRAALATALGCAVLLGMAGLAGAAAGELSYQDCLTGETESGPDGSGACDAIGSASPSGTSSGIDHMRSGILVGDRSLYALSPLDSSIIRFDRNQATGELSYAGCITGALASGPAGSGACAAIASASTGGRNSGLHTPSGVVASPDGEWLYVSSRDDNSVSTFTRDPATGELSYVGCLTGELESGPGSGGSGACEVIADPDEAAQNTGLQSLKDIAMSPDGESLYTAALDDDAVGHFDRDPATGALTYEGCISGKLKSAPPPAGSGQCAVVASAVTQGARSGFDQANSVSLSADGVSLYVSTNQDDSVVRFDRDLVTGDLTYRSCVTGDIESGPAPAGSGACNAVAAAKPNGINSGFDQVRALTVSDDGRSLYGTTSDGVLRFTRFASGALFYRECITAELESGPGGSGACTQLASATDQARDSGFDGLGGLTLSPNGRSFYVGAIDDSAIARFVRRPATGVLIHQGCVSGDATTTPCALVPGAVPSGSATGLDGLGGPMVSDDGRWLYGTAAFDDSVTRFARELP